ncbi:MAG: Multi-sensor Hybrid Histidine Kinase [Massilia sp.]|nr:Multi-sensor Hybrid Histidine Kinase [Massilia sp.]
MRYSRPGAAISLHAGADAGAVDGELAIEVADNGMGIPAELLPRIFEPFVQGERTLHGAVGGLGVGLALVKNLAAMHGGRVTARSDGPGQGSTFTVRLPLDLAPASAAPGPFATSPAVTRHSRSILVVDDNVDAADMLADMLRAHGHQVAIAYSPEKALETFARQPIDLAILDSGLPGMNGYELACACARAQARPGCARCATSP